MKEILIKYDENNDVQVNYNSEDDIKETLNVLLMTFNGLLHEMCKSDNELLYLIILETAQTLRTAPTMNFDKEEEIGEEEKEEQTEI